MSKLLTNHQAHWYHIPSGQISAKEQFVLSDSPFPRVLAELF
jgi:hypothetical protein